MTWVPLNVHSQYSILDSTINIKSLVKKAKEYEIEALALTDSCNMFGAIDFYKACIHENIKPILGCEVKMAPFSRLEKKKTQMPSSFPMILLVKDQTGYHNLCKLTSIGYLEGFYYYPRIDKEVLEKYSEGLICLSGGMYSYLSYLIFEEENALEEITWYQNVFKDDFYFDIRKQSKEPDGVKEAWVVQKMKNFKEKEEVLNEKLFSFSEKLNIACACTNKVNYLKKEDSKAHEILLNIQSGEPCQIWERDSFGNRNIRIPNPKRKIYPSDEFFFKSPHEMEELFSFKKELLENTKIISEKCNFKFNFKKKHYPVFMPPGISEKHTKKERIQLAGKHLYDLCEQNIKKKYTKEILDKIKNKFPDKDPLEIVKNRLDKEFNIISSKGLCDYILIVNDFVSWAKGNNIPVGPGRGSVAGCIMSYLIGITNIEPILLDLVFERFINPERSSYPDIDVDICMERRQEVIDYTIKKYKKDKVAQIITFGTMKAKMAIRDVGRVLNISLSKVDSIAKLIPDELNITIKKALDMDPQLKLMYKEDLEAKEILDIAQKLEGCIRNTSTHAAGIIISEDPIEDWAPVCTSKDSNMLVTQYSMKPIEAIGMLKIDFLGLKTLTSIQKAIGLIEKRLNKKIDWDELSLNDENTYKLLNQGNTMGVFQLESAGMSDLSKKLHIDKFEEIIAVGALYRPGPMDMIPSFINRKHKKEKIEIDHPLVKEILDETYGVMVYQEQVMQIASKLAGYTLGEADFLRKAMGKKDRKEMEKQKEKFITGCIENSIDEDVAKNIFEKIEKFASYGFNKSHAAAYAYLTYATAYFKANYPKEWMAALMTCDKDDLTKVSKFIKEAKNMKINILSPDVNESDMEFIATEDGIRFSLNGIKGIGSSVVEEIIRERKSGYVSFIDFIRRIDKKRVGKKAIELLIDAGAFDFTNYRRNVLKNNLEDVFDISFKEQKEKEKGVISFFSLLDNYSYKEEVLKEDSILDILKKEKELLGFYLTDHPLNSFKDLLEKLSCKQLKYIEEMKESVMPFAFVVDSIKTKISHKSKRKFAILKISDDTHSYELPVWPELYEQKAEILKDNNLLYGILYVEKKDSNVKLQCKYLDELVSINESMIGRYQKVYDETKKKIQKIQKESFERKNMVSLIQVLIDADDIKFSNVLSLKEIILENSGNIPLELHFMLKDRKIGTVFVDSSMSLKDDREIYEKIKRIQGVKDVKVST